MSDHNFNQYSGPLKVNLNGKQFGGKSAQSSDNQCQAHDDKQKKQNQSISKTQQNENCAYNKYFEILQPTFSQCQQQQQIIENQRQLDEDREHLSNNIQSRHNEDSIKLQLDKEQEHSNNDQSSSTIKQAQNQNQSRIKSIHHNSDSDQQQKDEQIAHKQKFSTKKEDVINQKIQSLSQSKLDINNDQNYDQNIKDQQSCEKQVQQLQKQITTKDQQLIQRNQIIYKMQRQYKQQQRNTKQILDQKQKLTQQISKLQKINKQNQIEIQTKKQQLYQMTSKIKKIEQQVLSLTEQKKHKQQINSQLQQQLNKAHKQVQQKTDALKNSQLQNELMQKHHLIKIKNIKMQNYQQFIQYRYNTDDMFKKQNKQQQQKHKRQIENLKNTIKIMKLDKKQLQRINVQQKLKISSLQTQLSSKIKQIKQYKAKIQEKSHKIITLQQKHYNLNQKYKKQTKQIITKMNDQTNRLAQQDHSIAHLQYRKNYLSDQIKQRKQIIKEFQYNTQYTQSIIKLIQQNQKYLAQNSKQEHNQISSNILKKPSQQLKHLQYIQLKIHNTIKQQKQMLNYLNKQWKKTKANKMASQFQKYHKIGKIQNIIEFYQNKITETQKKIYDFQRQFQKLYKQYAGRDCSEIGYSLINKIKLLFEQKTDQFNNLVSIFQQQKQISQRLQQNQEKHKQHYLQNQKKLQQAQKQKRILQRQSQSLKKHKQLSTQNIRKYAQTNNQLKKQKKSLQEQNKRLEDSINNECRNKQKLKNQLEQINSKIFQIYGEIEYDVRRANINNKVGDILEKIRNKLKNNAIQTNKVDNRDNNKKEQKKIYRLYSPIRNISKDTQNIRDNIKIRDNHPKQQQQVSPIMHIRKKQNNLISAPQSIDSPIKPKYSSIILNDEEQEQQIIQKKQSVQKPNYFSDISHVSIPSSQLNSSQYSSTLRKTQQEKFSNELNISVKQFPKLTICPQNMTSQQIFNKVIQIHQRLTPTDKQKKIKAQLILTTSHNYQNMLTHLEKQTTNSINCVLFCQTQYGAQFLIYMKIMPVKGTSTKPPCIFVNLNEELEEFPKQAPKYATKTVTVDNKLNILFGPYKQIIIQSDNTVKYTTSAISYFQINDKKKVLGKSQLQQCKINKIQLFKMSIN